jgi:hypothetical protein
MKVDESQHKLVSEKEPRFCGKLCFGTTKKSYKAMKKPLKQQKQQKQAS